MVNYLGVCLLASTNLDLATEELNPWKNASLSNPNLPPFIPVCFISYQLSRVIFVCTLLGLKNNQSTWARA